MVQNAASQCATQHGLCVSPPELIDALACRCDSSAGDRLADAGCVRLSNQKHTAEADSHLQGSTTTAQEPSWPVCIRHLLHPLLPSML